MDKLSLNYDKGKGEVSVDDNAVLMLSRGNLAHIQREFEKVMGPPAASIMYNSGKQYSQTLESNVKKNIIRLIAKVSKNMIAKKMLEVFSTWGYGHPEFIELTTNPPYARLKVTNSANAIGYGTTGDNCVCHFIRGVIAGAGTMIMGTDMECVENLCVAKGDPYCEFEVITNTDLEKRKLGE